MEFIQPEIAENSLNFALPPVMTIETAEALAAELKQLPLAEKTSLTLDVSQVQNITSPGLQLIVSLEKTITAQGGRLTITGERDAFVCVFKDAGLGSMLGQSS
ncbi:MAG: STAS domain-containing protein [Alphaproteobacteria bacterium]|nr:STAS domain-containing protein [Alphaproteobacteria bacterium]